MIKKVSVLQKRHDLSSEQFVDHWRNLHGPLVQRHAKALQVRRYVQSHNVGNPEISAFAESRGSVGRADGIAEAWWDSLEDMEAAFATQEGQAASAELAADEINFLDVAKCVFFLSEEHDVIAI